MVLVYFVVGFALIFSFLNGFHDSGNILTTVIFSRAMSPRTALAMTIAAEFAGPFLFGVAVAKTIGEELVLPQAIDNWVLVAALTSVIFWILFSRRFGIPSSSSHALAGGLIGAITAQAGFQAIQAAGLWKVILALFVAPVLGLLIGFLFTKLVFLLAKKSSMKINNFFKKGQIVTALGLALSQGSNDAQKTMGVIILSLVVAGKISSFEVPTWVVTSSALAIASGTAFGGWRLIRTLGGKFFKIKPVHGFTAQITSTAIILSAALWGGPVSTTQVVGLSVLGAGSAQRIKMVRWGEARNILLSWILTLPIMVFLSWGTYYLIRLFS